MKIRPIMMVRRELHGDDGQVYPCLVPIPRFATLFDRQHPRDREDHEYPMAPVEPRNMAWHRGYFAELKLMYDNLPDHIQKKFPTVDHLRAEALVHTHWCHATHVACKDEKEAQILVARTRRESRLAVIKLDGANVHIFDPASQAVSLMSKDDFEKSSRDVLAWVQTLNPKLSLDDVRREAKALARPTAGSMN